MSRRVPLPLLLLLLLFAALHLVYNWAIPLGEGPDEHGHLAYVLFLAAERRLPVQAADAAASDVPGEGHQPPLAYVLAVPAVAWLPPEQRQLLLTPNPRFVWAGGDEANAFRRGSAELLPWPPRTLAWHLTRAVSGLWGGVTVLCTYLATRRLRPADPALALLAAALVAFNPQFLFTTALANNDALLAALGAALLWWCVRGGENGGKRGSGSPTQLWWAVVAGLLFGLALLTKQSALLLGPLLLWAGWRIAAGRPVQVAAITLTWGGVALLVSGWWLLRNLALYGDLFGLAVFQSEFATQPFAWGDLTAWRGALARLFSSFWGYFGWLSLPAPVWSLWLYALLCLVAVIGLVRAARSHGPEARFAGPWPAPVIAVAMAFAWTLAFAATAGLVAWQGRMLFPALGAVAVLLAAGLQAVGGWGSGWGSGGVGKREIPDGADRLPPSPPHPHAPASLLIFPLLALALFMPFGVIRPGYSWVALAPRVAQAELGTPVFARYAASWERGVVLRGWRLDGLPAAGAALPLTLTWNSLEPVPRPWTVFVHLVDADGAIVAESNSQPRGGALPFPLWTPGDWVADSHTLRLPANLPPGEYKLRVGLYRPEKGGQRQQVWAEEGVALGDLATVGVLRVP